jgi:hypothetical protein
VSRKLQKARRLRAETALEEVLAAIFKGFPAQRRVNICSIGARRSFYPAGLKIPGQKRSMILPIRKYRCWKNCGIGKPLN